MKLTVAAFIHLAAQCGPSVHVDTLAAVAYAESHFNTLAIHDNTTGRSYYPASPEEAVRIATDLVTTKRHSADLGIMQINSANLAGFGMSVSDTFDTCKNIAAGARVLVAGYRPPLAGSDVQPALKRALSRYNTGHPKRGFTNGYVRRVQLAADQVVPAIRTGRRTATRGPEERDEEAVTSVPSSPPPSWDVFGQARYRRENGGDVFGGTRPAETRSQTPRPDSSEDAKPSKPVRLQMISDPSADAS